VPDWRQKLCVKSFEGAVQLVERYIENAEACIQLASIHPKDPSRFFDAKYSSTAGQHVYTASLVLIRGLAVEYPESRIDFRPKLLSPEQMQNGISIEELAEVNRKQFENNGLGSDHGFDLFLSLLFNEKYTTSRGTQHTRNPIKEKWWQVSGIMHRVVHCEGEDRIDVFREGREAYEDFYDLFVPQARQLLKRTQTP